MYTTDDDKKFIYESYMTSLKKLSKINAKELNYVSKKKKNISFKALYAKVRNFIFFRIVRILRGPFERSKILKGAINDRSECNYFFNDRIAIYTCIIGNYDRLLEPIFAPDNCDFYVITDAEVSEESVWKKINLNSIKAASTLETQTMINRYIKMHPHLIFNKHRYSIYVDGSFKIICDLTEHVNRLNSFGFATFRHHIRKCAYSELNMCRYLQKGTYKNLNKTEKYLLKNEFPKNYGLLVCGILVRDHSNPKCISIMNMWWNELCKNVKRDQIVLPYTLFKLGIAPDEIATLGNNMYEDYSFKIHRHS